MAAGTLQTLLHPKLFACVDDVHVFRTDGTAVGTLQGIDQISELGGTVRVMKCASLKNLIKVSRGQMMVGQIQDRHAFPFHHFKRIYLRLFVTAITIRRH